MHIVIPRGPRQVLEERFPQISDELETLFENSRDMARRELAEQLNQAARRLRIAPDAGELCATLEGAAMQFATGAELFRIEGSRATSEGIELPLAAAPALAAAIESRDPLTAAATAGEVSAVLVELFEHAPGTRVSIFPLDVRDSAPALIYCWGTVQVAAVELLAQVASAVWSGMPEPAAEPEPAAQLVTIAVAPPLEHGPESAEQGPESAPPPPAAIRVADSWDAMPPTERQIHLRAQRFARVHAAELRLYHAELVQNGRSHRNLYELLRQPIDTAREAFRSQFFSVCPSMVDYLHLELTRTLANDNTDLFGSTYPGPLA